MTSVYDVFMFAHENDPPRTVGELFGRYREVVLARVSPGTGRAYMVAWRRRVAPSFAVAELASLTTPHAAQDFVQWRGAYPTPADALSMLSALCRVAVQGGLIAKTT